MTNTKYDIFISYRRSNGAQYARILQLMLIQRGYRVFLDYDELKDGIFSEKIKAAIDEAPVFMLILTKDSMERCANEDDTVRAEIMRAYNDGNKSFIPVTPDNTFDGIKADVPKEIKIVAEETQRSEIYFGQTLGASVDYMIQTRLEPKLGKRNAQEKKDESLKEAEDTIIIIEKRNKRKNKIEISLAIVAVLIVLSTCFAFWTAHKDEQKNQQIFETQTEMKNNLEDKYKAFNMQLSPGLTIEQMGTIDTIMANMSVVKPDSLWMSQFEFTIGQWYGILGEKYDHASKNIPIANVSWGEVNLFIDSLRNMTNINFELPSVEDWEYAAHGGNNHESTIYVGNKDVNKVAWYKDNSDGHAHPSDGQQGKEPNMLDLYDMSGNVSEMTNSPMEHGVDNTQYIVCGGNYTSPRQCVTANTREFIRTDYKSPTVGFRLVIRKMEDL